MCFSLYVAGCVAGARPSSPLLEPFIPIQSEPKRPWSMIRKSTPSGEDPRGGYRSSLDQQTRDAFARSSCADNPQLIALQVLKESLPLRFCCALHCTTCHDKKRVCSRSQRPTSSGTSRGAAASMWAAQQLEETCNDDDRTCKEPACDRRAPGNRARLERRSPIRQPARVDPGSPPRCRWSCR
jgi:hypothetical protein